MKKLVTAAVFAALAVTVTFGSWAQKGGDRPPFDKNFAAASSGTRLPSSALSERVATPARTGAPRSPA